MASETIAHVLHVRFEGMNLNSVKRQQNKLVQMGEQKDRCEVHSLPWPSQNTEQT
jgi:hypothetical protein